MSGIKPTGNSEYKKRDKFKGCRENKKNKKQKQKHSQEALEGLQEPQPEKQTEAIILEQQQHTSPVWQHIDEVFKEAAEMKQAAETNNLDKTVKKYDRAMHNLTNAQKQVAKAEELRKKEIEKKDDKPKKEKQPPYKEVLVGVVEIDGKKKDKYDVQKTATSPIFTKYRVHKPVGLNEEQVALIKDRLNECMTQCKAMQDDFTEAQFKKVVSDFFKKEETTEAQAENVKSSSSDNEPEPNW